MRLLSQDGMYDVPYELVFIRVFSYENFYEISVSKDGCTYKRLATYSNLELVNYILDKMREEYHYGFEKYFKFKSEAEVQMQKVSEQGIENKIPYKG